MAKISPIEIAAARTYGLTVNAMSVFATSTTDSYAWEKSLESCTRQELQLIQDFMQKQSQQGIPGYITKIRKVESRLSSRILHLKGDHHGCDT